MMMINKLKPEDLQTKTFTLEIKGYKVEEINEFLDEIQQDYFYFLTEINNLKEENLLLKTKNNQLIQRQEVLNNELEALTASRIKKTKDELSNSDVLARISHIEKNLSQIQQLLEKTTLVGK